MVKPCVVRQYLIFITVIYMKNLRQYSFILLLVCLALPIQGYASVTIKKVEPTVFFPKQKANQPLTQLVYITLLNDINAADYQLKILNGETIIFSKVLKSAPAGESKIEIFIPDLPVAAKLDFQILSSDGKVLHSKAINWQPQKKWKIYNVAYSHHDMGYADYFQFMRRDVREMGIELALEYCKLTDTWDKESQFRWTVETSEPMASWIRNAPKEKVDELIARIKEKRIELGAIHNSVNTEMLSPEFMARLFYTPNRYVVDLLGIEPRKLALLDDVTGLTRSLPLYTKEAGLQYFFHGYNNLEVQLKPAASNPFFKWLSPDNDKNNMTWFQSTWYHCTVHSGDFAEGNMSVVQNFLKKYEEMNWPLSCVMARECWDFSLPVFDNSIIIKNWNKIWEYPKVVNATMTMFFEDGISQIKPEDTYVFDKDAPNSWVDQHYADFNTTSKARMLSNKLTEIETFGSFASASGAKGSIWDYTWAAINNLLNFAEHTMGASCEGAIQAPVTLKNTEGSLECYYETEYSMHRAFVGDAKTYIDKAGNKVKQQFDGLIKTSADNTLAVFNPLAFERTDVVRLEQSNSEFYLIDNVSGAIVPTQKMPDGSTIFVASDIPSMGYKTYKVMEGKLQENSKTLMVGENELENRFYKVIFDTKTGCISSILDKELNKELVDAKSDYKVGEYIYNYVTDKEENYRIESAELSSTKGAVSAVMSSNIKAKGMKAMQQMVILYNNIKRIDFVIDMDKAPSMTRHEDYRTSYKWGKESVYFAFPFNVPDFTIKHDLPGTVVEPITDQSEGSTTSHYGIQSFSDVSGSDFGITLATAECGLIEYGYPRHTQQMINESILKKPEKSYLFLYPMTNWFFTNNQVDQRGKTKMTWSISSHKGNWFKGKAYVKGQEISHPLTADFLEKSNVTGRLPSDKSSFVQINKPNIAISTIKPAEINGSGYILRVNEVCGQKTEVTISLPFLKKIDKAQETSLIEVDKGIPVKINGNALTFTINGFGLKTIRILSGDRPAATNGVTAKAVADMQVDLQWEKGQDNVNFYHVYRDVTPGFSPNLRNLVGRAETNSYSDVPMTKSYGWGSRLEPNTVYYYKVTAVNSLNTESIASDDVKVITPDPSVANSRPSMVLGLRGYLVSNVGHNRFAGMWFHSNPETDLGVYRIYRSLEKGFNPDSSNFYEDIDVTQVLKHITPHGFKTVYRQLNEYDAQVYTDENVEIGKVYYYKVCAIDKSGLAGEASDEVSIYIEPHNFPDVQAQSTFGSYEPFMAIDGSDQSRYSWVSAQYGGGTKRVPLDVWWSIKFPKTLNMKGIKISNDIRDSIPLPKKFTIEIMENSQWKQFKTIEAGKVRVSEISFDAMKMVEGIRISVKGNELSTSANDDQDGFARLSEVFMINGNNEAVPIRRMYEDKQ